jgi:hypothetical protein
VKYFPKASSLLTSALLTGCGATSDPDAMQSSSAAEEASDSDGGTDDSDGGDGDGGGSSGDGDGSTGDGDGSTGDGDGSTGDGDGSTGDGDGSTGDGDGTSGDGDGTSGDGDGTSGDGDGTSGDGDGATGDPVGTECTNDASCASGVCWDIEDYDPQCMGAACSASCSSDQECIDAFTQVGAPNAASGTCQSDGICNMASSGIFFGLLCA